MLILATHVTQASNDKQQIEPMLKKIEANPAGLNQPETLLADTGYYSEQNVKACVTANITPLISPASATNITRIGAIVSANPQRWPTTLPPSRRWRTGSRPAQGVPPTPCASRPSNRCSHHQVGDGVSAVSAARTRQRPATNGRSFAWRGT
jgi:hypothetical protein